MLLRVRTQYDAANLKLELMMIPTTLNQTEAEKKSEEVVTKSKEETEALVTKANKCICKEFTINYFLDNCYSL